MISFLAFQVNDLVRLWKGRQQSSSYGLERPNLAILAQQESHLPQFVRQCPVAMKYLRLLGPLDWANFPERPANRAWPGPTPHPRAPFVAAYLVKLNEGHTYMSDLRAYLPGQNWDMEIRIAVRNCDVILVCVSDSSVGKEGYFQKEIKFALDVAEEKPDGTIFIIPIKLDDCDVPYHLQQWQWIEYNQGDWYEKLIRALRERAKSLNLSDLPGDGPIDRIGKPIEEISGRLLYKSIHLRELLKQAKDGGLSVDDIEYQPTGVVVGISFEAVTEVLNSFSDEERIKQEKDLILRLIGIREPFDYWEEKNNKVHCFQNKSDHVDHEVIERISVVSSNITSIGYDPKAEILEVGFHNGSVYQYYDVPSYLYDGLMSASSHGKYLHRYIKSGGFTYRKMEG